MSTTVVRRLECGFGAPDGERQPFPTFGRRHPSQCLLKQERIARKYRTSECEKTVDTGVPPLLLIGTDTMPRPPRCLAFVVHPPKNVEGDTRDATLLHHRSWHVASIRLVKRFRVLGRLGRTTYVRTKGLVGTWIVACGCTSPTNFLEPGSHLRLGFQPRKIFVRCVHPNVRFHF